jgi:hypothetical protein
LFEKNQTLKIEEQRNRFERNKKTTTNQPEKKTHRKKKPK